MPSSDRPVRPDLPAGAQPWDVHRPDGSYNVSYDDDAMIKHRIASDQWDELRELGLRPEKVAGYRRSGVCDVDTHAAPLAAAARIPAVGSDTVAWALRG